MLARRAMFPVMSSMGINGVVEEEVLRILTGNQR